MYSELFAKFNSFAGHHQIIFTVIVAICLITISWAIEKILEEYIFHHKKLAGYIIAIFGSLFILWMVKHFILHAI